MSGAETLTPERVDQRSFTRCMVLDALVERGVASASLAKPRRSVLQLKTMLKDLLAGGGDAPMVPASARSEAAAQQLVGATSGTDMTLTVRQVLDPTARKLPGSKPSLQKIKKDLDAVRAALDPSTGSALPVKLHREVQKCLDEQDPDRRSAMMLALQNELDLRLMQCDSKQTRPEKEACRRCKDPVLTTLGESGRDRLLWECGKVYAQKPHKYGEKCKLPFGKGSYVAQLYDILFEHMDPVDVRRCKHMHSARVFRDFLVDWVFYWQNVLPPFIPRRSPKTQWTAEDWEKRHMHEIDDPEDKIQKLPLSVGDDVDRGEDEEEDAAADENASPAGDMADGDEDEDAVANERAIIERTLEQQNGEGEDE